VSPGLREGLSGAVVNSKEAALRSGAVGGGLLIPSAALHPCVIPNSNLTRVKNDWDAQGNLLRPGRAAFFLSDPNSGPLKFVAGAIK